MEERLDILVAHYDEAIRDDGEQFFRGLRDNQMPVYGHFVEDCWSAVASLTRRAYDGVITHPLLLEGGHDLSKMFPKTPRMRRWMQSVLSADIGASTAISTSRSGASVEWLVDTVVPPGGLYVAELCHDRGIPVVLADPGFSKLCARSGLNPKNNFQLDDNVHWVGELDVHRLRHGETYMHGW